MGHELLTPTAKRLKNIAFKTVVYSTSTGNKQWWCQQNGEWQVASGDCWTTLDIKAPTTTVNQLHFYMADWQIDWFADADKYGLNLSHRCCRQYELTKLLLYCCCIDYWLVNVVVVIFCIVLWCGLLICLWENSFYKYWHKTYFYCFNSDELQIKKFTCDVLKNSNTKNIVEAGS